MIEVNKNKIFTREFIVKCMKYYFVTPFLHFYLNNSMLKKTTNGKGYSH